MSASDLPLILRIHASSRFLDEKNYSDFLSLFTDQGDYSIIAKAPELTEPMVWMKMTKSELGERIDAIGKHEWQIEQPEQTRLVSVDVLNYDNDKATSSSSIAVYNTDPEGRSSCYVVGRYDDLWHYYKDNWYIQKREVILKTRLLTTLSPIPI